MSKGKKSSEANGVHFSSLSSSNNLETSPGSTSWSTLHEDDNFTEDLDNEIANSRLRVSCQ